MVCFLFLFTFCQFFIVLFYRVFLLLLTHYYRTPVASLFLNYLMGHLGRRSYHIAVDTGETALVV
jgi:hypothetical protein